MQLIGNRLLKKIKPEYTQQNVYMPRKIGISSGGDVYF